MRGPSISTQALRGKALSVFLKKKKSVPEMKTRLGTGHKQKSLFQPSFISYGILYVKARYLAIYLRTDIGMNVAVN